MLGCSAARQLVADGNRKGRYEFAIRWGQIGGIIGSSEPLKFGVYTTGDAT